MRLPFFNLPKKFILKIATVLRAFSVGKHHLDEFFAK